MVEVEYRGKLTAAELRTAVEKTIETVKSSGRRLVLGNCRQLEGGHSVVDLFYLADHIRAAAAAPADFREALVTAVHPDAQELVQFFENTMRNRGMEVRSFPDRATALQWLLEPQAKPAE